MSLYQTEYPNNSRVVSGTPAIFKDDVVLLCNTSTAPVVINLLEIPDNYWNTIWKLYVVDNSSNASVNNITINAGTGQTINGHSSITLTTNDESAVIRIASNNQFIASRSTAAPSQTITVKDEGTTLTTDVSSIDFVGSGVTATAIGNDVTVTIPSNQLTTKDEGATLTTNTASIDFVGSAVTATNVGDDVTVNILSKVIPINNEDVQITSSVSSITFEGNGVNATAVGDDVTVTVNLPEIPIKDEGVEITPSVASIDFVGNGVVATAVGNDVTVTIDTPDSGWVDLLGFDYISISKPQCRRIGKEIFFRGVIQIPMGSTGLGATGVVQSASSGDAYSNLAYGLVYDAGLTTVSPGSDINSNACLLYSSANPSNSGNLPPYYNSPIPSTNPDVDRNKGVLMYFRRGTSVIPSSVLPLGILDGTYTSGNRQIVNRNIFIGNDDLNFPKNMFLSVTEATII
jgi:hypothetical protein